MHRVTVEEAARRLGIEKESVRKRVYRGQLKSDKEPDGTLRVYIDSTNNIRGQSTDYVHGLSTDKVQGQSTDAVHGHESKGVNAELLSSLQDQIQYLRRESERKDAIIMQMAQANTALAARVPELEAPRDEPHAPETASDTPGSGDVPTEPEKRSWWRRWFGGQE